MASQPIYQFYGELKGYTPKIWRRFQVAGNITVARLGYIVMTMYEMQASHLFCIEYSLKEDWEKADHRYSDGEKMPFPSDLPPVIRYEVPQEAFLPGEFRESYDATEITVRHLASAPGLRLQMQYDYGDGWEVELRLEDIILDKELPGKLLPRVLEGKGYGIIEDCGGPPGLKRLATAFRKKSGPAYEECSEWLGRETLDLAAFDLEDMNFRLKKIPRIYQDLYEYGLPPTKRSIALLERAYLEE